jgi:hypothetical protein
MFTDARMIFRKEPELVNLQHKVDQS